MKALSRDGTAIAYDRVGDGPPVILVGGAFSYRGYPKLVELAELLSQRFTVVNYDRRGRGDSGDQLAYSVDREIEDLEALIVASRGPAYVWGMSSGAVLALRAAAAGAEIRRLALYEPPVILDPNGHVPPADFEERLEELVASGRRGAAVKYFMRKGMGAPAIFVNAMRVLPVWSRLKAVAHTLPYDLAVMGDTVTGKPLAPAEWRSVKAPTLVMAGEKTFPRARRAAQALADVLPAAEYRSLEGQNYNVSPAALAPALAAFFGPGAETRRVAA